jgi:hypothetical protein
MPRSLSISNTTFCNLSKHEYAENQFHQEQMHQLHVNAKYILICFELFAIKDKSPMHRQRARTHSHSDAQDKKKRLMDNPHRLMMASLG